MRKVLIGIDLCLVGMAAALSLLVIAFWRRFEHPWVFLLYHALALESVWLPARAYARFGGRVWSLLRHWWPAFIVPATFREMHFLIPAVHPRLYDAPLGRLDAALFGDVRAAIEPVLVPWFVDLMHVCYWSYFVTPFALGAALYRFRDPRPFRAAMTICVLGWYLSYLGYVAVPALGPYAVEAEPIPRGGAIMRTLHPKLLELEWKLPNAFPSGHVLVTLLCLACAWKWKRRLFWVAALPSAGLILATIVLRYHYVVDVIASFALAPPIVWAGLKLHALTERWKAT